MHPISPFLLIILQSLFLACSPPPSSTSTPLPLAEPSPTLPKPSSPQQKSQSLTRDPLGHRPGPKGFRTVIIDAGHGGDDSGAVSSSTKLREKDLALDTARRLKKQLDPHFRVLLLRSNDQFIELDDRVAFANRYESAILLSLHYNHSSSSIRGPETYYWRVDSHGLATRFQTAMEKVSPVENRNRGRVRRRLRLTRNPKIPCVLLEFGYLSNPAEAKLCADPNYRNQMAAAIAQAVKTQAAIGDLGTGPLPPPLNQPLSRPTDSPE